MNFGFRVSSSGFLISEPKKPFTNELIDESTNHYSLFLRNPPKIRVIRLKSA